MLVNGNQVRLTPKEHKVLTGLAGSDSRHIKNRQQLQNFVHTHLVNYPGRSPEETLLRRMLESFLPS